jgi:hypothetical protein
MKGFIWVYYVTPQSTLSHSRDLSRLGAKQRVGGNPDSFHMRWSVKEGYDEKYEIFKRQLK